MEGFLNVLKPPGISSHDVVRYLRVYLSGIKIGHGGTLDPGAAGVLPVMLGKATRLSSFLLDFPKVYRAELFLGITTDTADSYGKVVEQRPSSHFKINDIKKVLHSFTGEIRQTPPMFSALKRGGKKLYEYARQGVTLERKARNIKIYFIDVLAYFPPERLLLEIKCSKGTYIRTLCSDIGQALGCGGHMSFLLRKEVGKFRLAEASTLTDLAYYLKDNLMAKVLLPLDYIFEESGGILLEERLIKALCQGQKIPLSAIKENLIPKFSSPGGALLPVYSQKKEFVALACWEGDQRSDYYLKPKKVFKSINNYWVKQ